MHVGNFLIKIIKIIRATVCTSYIDKNIC
jgi:hypothetical protein